MKPNTYLVSKKSNRTVIHKLILGKDGEDGDGLEEVKSLNLVMGDNDMNRLQDAFDQVAKDELEKQQQAE